MHRLQEEMSFQRESFRINLPCEQIAHLLFNCYAEQVRSRNREFLADEHTEKQIFAIAEILSKPSSKFGILLMGPCGNGKTTMLHAIRMLIHFVFSAGQNLLVPKINTSIPIISAKDAARIITEENPYAYRGDDLLMIDDLGHEGTERISYGMIHTPLVDLLEARYARLKYTIISSNLEPNEIRPKYHNRLADRFNEMMHVVRFTGETYRNL